MFYDFKYWLYPTRSQERRLEAALEVCRRFCNALLVEWMEAHRAGGRVSHVEQRRRVAVFRAPDAPDAPYAAIAGRNRDGRFEQPIYVGKAVPAGARKGGRAAEPARRARPGVVIGGPLYKRLVEHAESVQQATNLDLANFRCRYLVVDDIWIPLAESLMIEQFRPVWNLVIDGFGNHDPGAGRRDQKRSIWKPMCA